MATLACMLHAGPSGSKGRSSRAREFHNGVIHRADLQRADLLPLQCNGADLSPLPFELEGSLSNYILTGVRSIAVEGGLARASISSVFALIADTLALNITLGEDPVEFCMALSKDGRILKTHIRWSFGMYEGYLVGNGNGVYALTNGAKAFQLPVGINDLISSQLARLPAGSVQIGI